MLRCALAMSAIVVAVAAPLGAAPPRLGGVVIAQAESADPGEAKEIDTLPLPSAAWAGLATLGFAAVSARLRKRRRDRA